MFDPDHLHEIVQSVISDYPDPEDVRGRIDAVVERVDKAYPGYLQGKDREEWLLNFAGNAVGQMWPLRITLSSYLIIFGTPHGPKENPGIPGMSTNAAFTGRYPLATDFFMPLTGIQLGYAPGDMRVTVHKPGDMHILKPGDAEVYEFPGYIAGESTGGGFALEYACGGSALRAGETAPAGKSAGVRGAWKGTKATLWSLFAIPSMLPFGLVQIATSTHDYYTAWRTVYVSAWYIVENLLRGQI